jgi:hypothetical protein
MAVAMVATPAVAAAEQSTAVSRAAAAEVTPADEAVQGDNDMFRRRRGFIIPLFAITLVILGLIIVFHDNDGAPVSP